MKFPINTGTTYLAILIIILKIIYTGLSYALPDLSEPSSVIIIGTLNFLGAAYIYFYLKNFTDQIIGSNKLNFPLQALGWLVLFIVLKDIVLKLNYRASLDYLYLLYIPVVLLAFFNLFLFIRIWTLPSGIYKKYLVWFGIFLIINLICSPILILLQGIIMDRGWMDPGSMYGLFLLSTILRQLPFAVVLLMIVKYNTQNRKAGKNSNEENFQ
jgi:uncharacterized membrane protein